MASKEPMEGRCAAEVTRRAGIELDLDQFDEILTSDDIDSMKLVRGAVTTIEEPEYSDVYNYFDHGFELTALDLKQTDGSVESVEVGVMHPDFDFEETVLEGYCERWPMDSGRCWNHGGASTGAPEGNLNAATHFLKADPDNFYNKKLDDKEKAVVHKLAEGWQEKGGFDRDDPEVMDIFRIAVDQVRLWKSHEHFAEYDFIDDFVVGVDDEGNPVEKVEENPANLPYSRLSRDNLKQLKEYGCLDDPDSQKAEATESLAEKFANLGGN